MTPTAERPLPSWDFALPSAERPRALWARAQRALKRFLFGAPEDALLAAAYASRMDAHVALFALLTMPLILAWHAGGIGGRWAILFSLLSGLLLAARLESTQQPRANPLSVLGVGFFWAVVLTATAWELIGRSALRLDPSHVLAGIVAALGLLATRSDPRLCVLVGLVGVLLLALLELGASAASAGTAPALITATAASCASTLAALRGERLERRAILDASTGALHAAAFERCLIAAQQRAHDAAEPVMVARIEFSALPLIRQTHGAAFADALMRWLARALLDRFRATDLLGRTGDDEFSLALPSTDHPGVARRLERLREEFDTVELSRGGLREPIALRIAYGLAAFPREAAGGAAAQRLAGERLALAKWKARLPA
jgi:diguanylate cyclase (GGDEF)-like protein